MSSNDYGGYGTAEKQRKALSDAMNTSMSKYADQWSQYSTKPWVENTQKDAKLNDYQLSQKLLTEKKIEQATTQLEKVELAIIDVQQKKDELKTIETMKTGNSRTNIQMKMASNQAYRTLASQETQLETQKNQLEKQINSYKSKVEKIDLASDAGKIFSAGIRTDAVMDIDAPPRNPITSSAMTPEERAFSLDKQNSLIDPNFSLNDIAKGVTDQVSFSDKSILNKALASPVTDAITMIQNPTEYQKNLDYGYTAMANSAREITKEPDKLLGNVIGEAGLTVAGYGSGKIISKGFGIGSKIIPTSKEINSVEKMVMQADMGKLDVNPKIQAKVSKEMKPFYDSTGLNPNGTVDLVALPTKTEKAIRTKKTLDKVAKEMGTTFYTGYTAENAKKYTGVGIGIGAGVFGVTQNKNKKSTNIFNFKY